MNRSLNIKLPDAALKGILAIPEKAEGLVVFAHGSGSGRLSPRNRFVAEYLQERNMGTFLFDLLTGEEEQHDALTASYRFNIPFLAGRLADATDRLIAGLKSENIVLPVGFFGASTGAAAAIVAAALNPGVIKAIVSRGGRPDLAGPALSRITAPTLLIVGQNDKEVLALNQAALGRIYALKDLRVVPGATHLFEEPGTLEQAAGIAAAWFKQYLRENSEARN